MKKIITVIISAIAFGLIAGLVMVGVNVFSVQTGIVKNNAIVSAIDDATKEKNLSTKSQIDRTDANNYNYRSSVTGGNVLSITDNDLSTLIENVMPSVVSITNMQKFKQNGYSMFGFRVQPQEYEAPASGSGVIVSMTDEQVIILTNNHVIEQSANLSVKFDTENVDAAIKGTDTSNDLAIISVSKKDIPPETFKKIKIANIGNSDNVKVGQRVLAIGNALGIGQSVTSGIISGKDREIEGIDNSSKLLQTDAPINPGNSGGALINMRGELIGINVAKSAGNSIEGVGYAIPINDATEVIETMSKKKDRVEIPENEQGQIGIIPKNVDSNNAEMFKMPIGIFVYEIPDYSSAKNSELKERDVIIEFDNQSVKTTDDLQELLRYTKAGQEVDMKVMRDEGNGEYVEKSFKIKLGKKKVENNQKNESQEKKQESSTNNGTNNGTDNGQGNGGSYYSDPFGFNDPFGFDPFDIFREFGW